MEITVTKSNFQQEVIGSDKPVLLDFWATWCGPCKMIAPVLEEIGREYADKIKIGKVNVDEEGELAMQFGITSIPTVILFRNGKIEKTSVGYRDKAFFVDMAGL